jgi:hypothetical protein
LSVEDLGEESQSSPHGGRRRDRERPEQTISGYVQNSPGFLIREPYLYGNPHFRVERGRLHGQGNWGGYYVDRRNCTHDA